MQSYIFHQLGVIPGIPGTFGNCRVDIADDGTITQTPLAPIPGGETAATSEVQQAQETVVAEPTVIVRTAPFSTSNGG